MRYFILLCFMFFSSVSYAIIPSESINTSIPIVKEESKSKKEIKKQQKKEKQQLKKQTQKLKWQLLKNAFKAHKATKKLNTQNKKDKKDRKPIYWASWLSALLAVIASVFLYASIVAAGLYTGLLIAAMIFGIGAAVMTLLSLHFITNNPKGENDNYNRILSIIFTLIGGTIGLPFLGLLLVFIYFLFLSAE